MTHNIIGLCIGVGLALTVLGIGWLYEFAGDMLELMEKCDEVEMR